MEKIVEIEGLKKSFGEKAILRGVALTLERGQNLGILGKSGSGKSVLTKCIVRLIEPDAGRIIVFGQDVLSLKENPLNKLRKRIGYLFQGGALYDSMSVRENLEFPIRRTMMTNNKREITEMIEESLENVGLIDAIDKMPAELSGGMRKRIGLARTLILRPDIILYDEPTTGLDAVTSGNISELIVKIQEKYQTSSIIITHDLKCAEIATDKIKILDAGQFYTDGTFQELSNSNDPNITKFFI